MLKPKPGDDPIADKLQKELDVVKALLTKQEQENSNLQIKQHSNDVAITQLEENYKKSEENLLKAKFEKERAIQEKEDALLERKVAN